MQEETRGGPSRPITVIVVFPKYHHMVPHVQSHFWGGVRQLDNTMTHELEHDFTEGQYHGEFFTQDVGIKEPRDLLVRVWHDQSDIENIQYGNKV